MPDTYQRKCDLALRVQIQQGIHLRIHKAQDYVRRQSQSGSHCQQVRQDCPVVPSKMAICPCSVFPRVSPVRACADDHGWSVHNARFIGRGVDQGAPIIPGPEQSKRKVARTKMVNTRFQARQVANDEVEFEFVQRARTRGRAEVALTARVCLLFRNSRRKVKEAGEILEARSLF